MSEGNLLEQVQHALCCPKGCRALIEGDLEACGAKLTKEHAQAAIDVCQTAYRDKIRALVRIRDDGSKLADDTASLVEGDTFGPVADKIRSLAKIASDALK